MARIYGFFIIALFVSLGFWGGVAAQDAPETVFQRAHIRVANFGADAPPITYTLTSSTDAESAASLIDAPLPLDLGTLSDHLALPAGEYQLVLADEDGLIRVERMLSLAAGDWATFALIGDGQARPHEIIRVEERITDLPNNLPVRLFFLNATLEDRIQFEMSESIQGDIFPINTWSLDVPSGDYALTPLGEATPPDIRLDAVALQPYTSYLIGFYQQDGTTQTSITATPIGSTLTIDHLAVNAPQVTLWLDDTPILENVTFEQLATIQHGAGVFDLRVVSANLEEEITLLEQDGIALEPDTHYRLTFWGDFATDADYELVLEAGRPPTWLNSEALHSGQNAFIEITHALVDGPPLDVIRPDGTMLIEGLAYGQTGTLDLPAQAYDLLITASDDPATVLYDLSGVQLQGGQVYQLAAVGRLEAVQNGTQRLATRNQCVLVAGCEN